MAKMPSPAMKMKLSDKGGVRARYAMGCGSDADCVEMGKKKGMKNPSNPFRSKVR